MTNFQEATKYFEDGQRFQAFGLMKEAFDSFSKVITLNPKHTRAYYAKGLLLSNRGYCQESIPYFDKVIELDPKNSEYYFKKGNTLVQIGEFDEAVECFDKVIEIKPKDDRAYAIKADINYKLYELDEAKENINKAIEIDNNEISYYCQRGRILWMNEENVRAEEDFKRVVRMVEDNNFGKILSIEKKEFLKTVCKENKIRGTMLKEVEDLMKKADHRSEWIQKLNAMYLHYKEVRNNYLSQKLAKVKGDDVEEDVLPFDFEMPFEQWTKEILCLKNHLNEAAGIPFPCH